MPKSRRKFAEWSYRDEGTNKEHPIQVYTVSDGDRVEFEADVKTPARFVDRDENYNTLKVRVLARCAEENRLTWTPYYLLHASMNGFADPFNVDSGRRHLSVVVEIDGFEVSRLKDGTQVWRGIAGKSHRYGPHVKPGWPPLGRDNKGGWSCAVMATPESWTALDRLHAKFLKVALGMLAAASPSNTERTMEILVHGDPDAPWMDFIRAGTDHTPTTEEARCQESPA
jgi:hypothetical protein